MGATHFTQVKLIGPVLAVLAIFIAGVASFPYFAVSRVDAEARQREEALVSSNIALWIGDIEFALTAWTVWDESIVNVDNNFNREWIDRNIGASLIGTSRTRFVAIVDGNDDMIYSYIDAADSEKAFFARGAQAMVRDAAQLVAETRLREAEGPRKPGIPDAVVTSRMEVLGDEAVLLSATLFQPDFGTAKPKGAHAPILITAMPIKGTLQDFFGKRFLLADAQISALRDVAPDRARAEIAVGPAGEVLVLSWQPQTPAADAFAETLPLIMAVCLLLLAGSVVAVRISRVTAEGLLRQEREMRYAATHDFLTGLANRSSLQSEFDALAQAGPLAVACLDLDGFKAVNDTYGHAAGDQLLTVVADRLRIGTRDGDRLFRFGGDEFALLLPDRETAEVEEVCRRLQLALSKPIALSADNVLIGASFGIFCVGDHATSCDTALKNADAALYGAKAKAKAKASGRGAVVMAKEGSAARPGCSADMPVSTAA